MTSFRTLLALCLISVLLIAEARSPRRVQSKNTRSVAQATVVIDDFSSSTRFANSENSLLGFASDDGSCGASWTAGGLSLSNTSSGCYYYTVFPANTCYSLSSESFLRITVASPAPSFMVALQDRNVNCTRRLSTVYVSSSAYTLASPSPALQYVQIPLAQFSSGLSLQRLHGVLLDSFSSAITIRSIEVVSDSTPVTTAAPTSSSPSNPSDITFETFDAAGRATSNTNRLGGFASDDGTCPISFTPSGLYFNFTSSASSSTCYFYSLFPSCYSIASSYNLQMTILPPPSATSLPDDWTFLVSFQFRDVNCTSREKVYSVAADKTHKIDTTTISIPLQAWASQGAALNRFHGILLSTFSTPLIVKEIKFVPSGTTTTTTSSPITTTPAVDTTTAPSTSTAALVIDDFSSSTRVTSNTNSMGGFASDDSTCSLVWSSSGLTVTSNGTATPSPNCYYYTLFARCFAAASNSVVKISFTNAPVLFSFIIGLQSREATCTSRDKVVSLSSVSYPKVVEANNITSISIPMIEFFSKGIVASRLNGFVFSSFSTSMTFRSIELITPAPEALLIDSFDNQTRLMENRLNALGGYEDDDDSCTTKSFSADGFKIGGTGCYFYTILSPAAPTSSCFQARPDQHLRVSVSVPVSATSPFSFTVGMEIGDPTCSYVTSYWSVSSSVYTTTTDSSSGSSTTMSISIPLIDFQTQGADLSRVHAFVFEGFDNTQVVFRRIELLSGV